MIYKWNSLKQNHRNQHIEDEIHTTGENTWPLKNQEEKRN